LPAVPPAMEPSIDMTMTKPFNTVKSWLL